MQPDVENKGLKHTNVGISLLTSHQKQKPCQQLLNKAD